MTPEKEALISSINEKIEVLQNDFKVNNAKILQWTGEHLKTDDPNVATEEQLKAFDDFLLDELNERNYLENELKDKEPDEKKKKEPEVVETIKTEKSQFEKAIDENLEQNNDK